MIRGRDCDAQRPMEITAPEELFLRPGLENRSRRLTGTMSRLHLNDNFRYNSQSTAALMTPEPSVGGRGWPNVRLEDERKEKALALWLNTGLGLAAHWATSNHSQNGLGYVSQKQARNMPVLNVHRLTPAQLDLMAEIFDRARDLPLLPANEAWRDRVRIELERRVLEDVPGLGEEATAAVRELCCRWCLEPTVQGRKCRVAKRQPDMERLAELAGASHRTARSGGRVSNNRRRKKMTGSMNTPWGRTTDIEKLDEGVWLVTTPGHGGLKLDGKRWEELPGPVRDSFITPTFAEEDCEEPIARVLPGLADERERGIAAGIAQRFPRYAPALPYLMEAGES